MQVSHLRLFATGHGRHFAFEKPATAQWPCEGCLWLELDLAGAGRGSTALW